MKQVGDRKDLDNETDAKETLLVIEVTQPGVDAEARWVKKGGNSVFGYKQHTVVDGNGLVVAVETTVANCHDSKPLLDLLDKANIQPGTRIHADKAYSSQKHRDALKSRGIKNGIQNKATKNNPLTRRQLQRNRMITKVRYVVERTFGSQARWFNAKILRYCGLAKAHTWHILLAMAYNLKRLPKLFAERQMIAQIQDYFLITENSRFKVIIYRLLQKNSLKILTNLRINPKLH